MHQLLLVEMLRDDACETPLKGVGVVCGTRQEFKSTCMYIRVKYISLLLCPESSCCCKVWSVLCCAGTLRVDMSLVVTLYLCLHFLLSAEAHA